MAEAKKGKNLVLLWRLLENETTDAGTLMMFQTEHSVEKSSDSDSTVTKTGTIQSTSVMEEEIPFTSLVADDDPVIEWLHEAIDEGKLLEQWEIDISKEAVEGKYPAKYRQGYLTELSTTANAEDDVEVEGTFKTSMKAQKGEATFTMEQLEAVQYQFKDTIKVTEGE